MKALARISISILFINSLTTICLAGGDLGGGGLRKPKGVILTTEQKQKIKNAQSVEEQKAIWLDSLKVEDEEKIYDAVFKTMIQPQINPLAEE